MPESYYSHQLPDMAAQTDPVQRTTAFMFLEALRRELPGWQTTNRWNQSQHFTQIVYIAIRAIMDLIGGSNTQVMRRKRPHRNRSTFHGPGGFIKSMPGEHHSQSEEYTPFDDIEHPLGKLSQYPNPVESMGEVLSRLVLQNRLTGVGPLWCVPNSEAKPVEIYALETALMYPLWQQTLQYPFGAWQVQPYYAMGQYTMLPGTWGAGGAILPGEEVHRFMDPHPIIKWDGYSPLTAGSVGLDVLEAIDQSRWAMFDHGLQLDSVLIAPGLSPEQIDKITAQMQNRHAGAQNARRFGVISPPPGVQDKFDLKPFGQTAKEMDYVTSWEQAVSFCLALFGVPKGVVCLDAAGSYAKLYADLRQFHHRQGSFARRLAEFLTRSIARPWCRFPGEFRFQIDLPKLDDPDLKERQLSRQLQYDLLTYNEARAADDYKPVDGGDIPASLYVEKMKQEIAPPEPPPGAAPSPEGQPGQEEEESDPLAALLSGAGDDGASATNGPGGPTEPSIPQPKNKLGKGSLPSRMGKARRAATTPVVAKSMSAYSDGLGATLIPPAGTATKKRKRKKRATQFVRRVLKSLEVEE